jgi:hypothetical protein
MRQGKANRMDCTEQFGLEGGRQNRVFKRCKRRRAEPRATYLAKL